MILVLGEVSFGIEEIRKDLMTSIDHRANPVFVFAKDGPDAARKIKNQHFDAIVFDPSAPRLQDSDFADSLRQCKKKTLQEQILLSPHAQWTVPVQFEDVDLVLAKPYTLDSLVRALAKALVPAHREPSDSSTSKFAVDVRILNALIKSTCFVCQQYNLSEIQLSKPEIKSASASWQGDIAASIGINSRLFQGNFIISFDESTYLYMYGQMLGEQPTSLNQENSDAIGEISNIILGNAKSDFTQYDVGMSIPRILAKTDRPESPPNSAALMIQGTSSQGRFFMEVVAHRMSHQAKKAS